MKKLVLLVSTLAISSSISASTDRDIYDVMYLPKAQTAYGSSTLGFRQIKRESDLGDIDFEGVEFTQTIGFSLSDRFSLSLDMDYAKIEADPEFGTKYNSVQGLSDPSLTVRFRAVDEAFRLDLVGGALSNFQDRVVDVDGDTNNTLGGHAFLIGPEFGVKAKNVQWFAGAYLIHNLGAQTKYKGRVRNVTVEDDSNNELLARTSFLHRLHEKNFLLWSAQGRFTRKVGNDKEDFIGKTPSSTSYEFGLEYEYVASESIMIRLGGKYQMFETRTGQIDEFQGWSGDLGASYEF